MTSTRVAIRGNRRLRVPGLAFRRSVLTPAGWMAVLAPGAAAGAALAVTASGRRRAAGRLATGIGAGALTGLLITRAVDEVQWRRSAVSLPVDEPDAALDLMQAVRAEGVQADMVRADSEPDRGRPHYALRYRAKDDRRVRAVFARQQR
jgi:hypothetical protein